MEMKMLKLWIRKISFVALLCTSSLALFFPSRARAVQRSVGAGFVLGEPTGLSAKIWIERNRAVDAGVAFSLNEYFLVYGDYLFHFPALFRGASLGGHELLPYVGPGVMLAFDTSDSEPARFYRGHSSNFALGLRVPFGLEWVPPRAPLGVFVEVVPGVGFIPETFAVIGAGIGVRYYF
jgi:hypothetical protein